MTLGICVGGVSGWTGSAVARAVLDEPDFELSGAVARKAKGQDAGQVIGRPAIGLPVEDSVEAALKAGTTHVYVDYTHPSSVKANVLTALEHGVPAIVGTSGLSAADYAEIAKVAGVSKQTIYNHYGSKHELVRALIRAGANVKVQNQLGTSAITEAAMAIESGVDVLGLVSAMPSGPGPIPEDLIAEIAVTIPPGVSSFLLTCHESVEAIIDQQRRLRVNTIQICDRLPAGSYRRLREALPGVSLVQVVHVTGQESIDEAVAIAPEVDAILLDSGNQSLPIKELGDQAPEYDRPWVTPEPPAPIAYDDIPRMPVHEALLKLLASPNLSSRRWVWEQYDTLIQGNTLQRPGGDAGVVRVDGHPSKALAFSCDVTPRYCEADPYEGGKQAVAECWRNLTAVGALPLAATDNLNFGNPERPEIMGQLVRAIAGIAEACRETDQPVPETRGAVVRCVLESLALAHRRTIREAAELAGRDVDVVHVEGDELADAQAGGVQHLEHRPVTQGDGLVTAGCGQESFDLVGRQRLGQPAPQPRPGDLAGRVLLGQRERRPRHDLARAENRVEQNALGRASLMSRDDVPETREIRDDLAESVERARPGVRLVSLHDGSPLRRRHRAGARVGQEVDEDVGGMQQEDVVAGLAQPTAPLGPGGLIAGAGAK